MKTFLFFWCTLVYHQTCLSMLTPGPPSPEAHAAKITKRQGKRTTKATCCSCMRLKDCFCVKQCYNCKQTLLAWNKKCDQCCVATGQCIKNCPTRIIDCCLLTKIIACFGVKRLLCTCAQSCYNCSCRVIKTSCQCLGRGLCACTKHITKHPYLLLASSCIIAGGSFYCLQCIAGLGLCQKIAVSSACGVCCPFSIAIATQVINHKTKQVSRSKS